MKDKEYDDSRKIDNNIMYRGWRIDTEHGTPLVANKEREQLYDFMLESLKKQIDELENKREKLFSQTGEYKGWKITKFGEDWIIAKKKKQKDITAYFDEDIRKKIDKFVSTNEIVYEEKYCGWRITKKRGNSNYSAEKKTAHMIIDNGGPLKWVKEEIDKEEGNLKEELKVLANPENFSEEYKGWTIKIKNGKLIAMKEERYIPSHMCLKKQGLVYCKNAIHDMIDRYEIHKNDPQNNQKENDDNEYWYPDHWKNE